MNDDKPRAIAEMKAMAKRNRKAFSQGLLVNDPVKTKPKTANPERALLEFKRDTIAEGVTALNRQKLRALTKTNGKMYTGKDVASARLGTALNGEYIQKDGITRSKLASANSPCLAIVAATVIKTLNFPKGYVKQGETPAQMGDFDLPDKSASQAMRKASLQAKAPRKLSPLEECEVFQTVAMVLIGNDALHLEVDASPLWLGKEFGLWKMIYSACRDTLGIDRMEYDQISLPDHDPIFTLRESIRTGYDAETIARARIQLQALVDTWEASIQAYAIHSSDAKRKANAKNASVTLQALVNGELNLANPSKAEMEKNSKARAKLEMIVSFGNRTIQAEAEEQAKRALEKTLAMAMHAHLCADCA